ncbi:unnamed protein product [Heligmosomoides polygyrus]|uniref:BAG domain-containing protein n=1 Tax=Heligmosomoides polygyrus TaxID=6339 RepID=A0A183FQA4_HELPZ|nr:unnamed protein product [Heligmosomoides polygyrus]
MTEGNNNDNNDQKQDEQMDISNANNGTDQPPEPAAQDLSSPVDDIAQSMKAVQELVKQLHEKLETLHNDAIEKEAAARKARHDIARVENQLKALLTMADYTDVLPAEKDLPSEKSTEPKGNPDPPPVKRGLCNSKSMSVLCSGVEELATSGDVLVLRGRQRWRCSGAEETAKRGDVLSMVW